MSKRPPDRASFPECAAGELRILNADLVCQRRPLAGLMLEEYPAVSGGDGNRLLFKKKELQYLASLLEEEERNSLLLPIIMEVTPERNEVTVPGGSSAEARILSHILGTPVASMNGKLIFYKSQLGEIRKRLRTTTQYRFCLESDE